MRSSFMRSEEIDRERAMSGWNPYYGEEEEVPEIPTHMEPREQMDDRMHMEPRERIDDRMRTEPRERMDDRMRTEPREQMDDRMHMEPREQMDDQMRIEPREQMDDRMGMQPYFMQPDYAQVLEEQKVSERDLRMLQSMYPEAAKIILPYIEEECDKMEYEGSTMYDEHPDPTTIHRLEQRICEQIKDRLPGMESQQGEEIEDVFSMQYRGPGRGRPGRHWPEDLIRVLLLQEMHHRRCRHRGCRRGRP